MNNIIQKFKSGRAGVLFLVFTAFLALSPLHAVAAPEDCVEDGGQAICTSPVIAPPTGTADANTDGEKFVYGMCDVAAPHMARIAAWCAAEGGTWTGTSNPECVNIPPEYIGVGGATSEGAATSAGEQFATSGGQCSRTMTSDTGWGFTDPSDQFCWSGGTNTKNGTVIRQLRRQIFSGNQQCQGDVTIKYLKTRQIVCPNQFAFRENGGELECFIPPSECCVKKNPVDISTGAKLQRERDYSSGDGLEFTRYYNSHGAITPFTSTPRVPTREDYWRHSYSRRIFPAPANNPNVMAIRQFDDGSLSAFNASGAEIHNNSGAAARLVNLGSAGWELTLANHDVETYDASGRFISLTTRAGLTITATYDSNGKLETLSNSFGRTLTLTYDLSGRLETLTLPDSSEITYAYDDRGRPVTTTYADATVKTYHFEDYNNGWLLTGITDESQSRFSTYTYTANGYVQSEEHAGGANRATFQFGDPRGNGVVTRVWDAFGRQRDYHIDKHAGVFKLRATNEWASDMPTQGGANFDSAGNATGRWDLNGRATGYTYDLTRNLEISRTDGYAWGGATTPANRTITTQWHSTFRLPTEIKVYTGTSATGTPLRVTTFTHDGAGNVLTRTVTDPTESTSRTWTYTYDSFGRVLTENGPRTDAADVTTYTYYQCSTGSECGQLHTVTNALNQVTTYDSYNAHGQPTQITDPNNVVTTLAYDARQHLTDRCVGGTLPSCTGGELIHMEYWPTGLLKKTVAPDGSITLYTYDAAHRLTQIEDGQGNRVTYVLDAMGNRTSENAFDPYGTLLRSQQKLYNVLGQLWQVLTVSRSDSEATVFSYDAAGNQTLTKGPMFRETRTDYDAISRISQITDAAGGLTRFTYDANDNLTSVIDPRNLTTTYAYNGHGDLKTQVSPDTGSTANTYDSGGNLATSTDARSATAAYTYDALNRPLTAAFSLGGSTDQTITYGYDAGTYGKGRLTSASDSAQSLSWVYDAQGRVTEKTQTIGGSSRTVAYGYTNGNLTTLTTPSGKVVTYTYANGRVSSISVDNTVILDNVQYDPFGPVTGWTWGNNTLAVRSFDLDGRVTLIDSAGLSVYGYHDDGTIASRSDDAPSAYTVPGGSSTVSVSSTSNRISAASGTLTRAYTYDAAGNTLSSGETIHAYNNRGRMKTGRFASTSTDTEYLYNAVGQRIRKTNGPAGSVKFVYDEAGHLIGEYNGSNSLVQETIWLGDIPVATLRPNGGGYQIFYVHTDHLNTPRRVSQPSNNTVLWRWASDAFGEALPDEDADGDTISFVYNLRFPGQYFDIETALNYNYFRDYDPGTGRYPQSDPIGIRGGVNTYGYVSGNPIMSIDRVGLQAAVPGVGPAAIPGVIINSAPIAQPGSRANSDWASNAWNQIDAGLSALGNAIGNMGRPKGMTRDEESVYDRYCKGGGDPCPPLKAATMGEIIGAKAKMNDLLIDKLGLYGSDNWFNHQDNLRGRINKIFAMISLGQKLGCDMTPETLAATDLMVPGAPR